MELCCITQQPSAFLCLPKVSKRSTNTAGVPQCSGKTTVTSSISLERAEGIEQNPGAFAPHLLWALGTLSSLLVFRTHWTSVGKEDTLGFPHCVVQGVRPWWTEGLKHWSQWDHSCSKVPLVRCLHLWIPLKCVEWEQNPVKRVLDPQLR